MESSRFEGVVRAFFRYVASGFVNTIVGFVFFSMAVWFGFPPTLSNFIAYAFGVLSSLALSRLWVFRGRPGFTVFLARFAAIFLVAYLSNLVAFLLLHSVFHLGIFASQLIGMGLFSLVFFFLGLLFLGSPLEEFRLRSGALPSAHSAGSLRGLKESSK